MNKNKWKAIVWLIVLPFFFIPFGRGQNSKFDFTALDKENEEIEINPQDPWKREEVITPQELVDALRKSSKKKDLVIFHVGFSFLYKASHIPGSDYVGSGKDKEGIANLEKKVSGLSKNQQIVLYCGCCPWNQCPNIRPAFNALKQKEFANLKVLFIPHDFAQDWIRKGYPIEKGFKN
ncbi:sulfurtransferase [Methylacidiphilum sp. Yel]|uniref:rhodanese-like domain-containing protein n=1 Tax=Methylacidiphilum sp. Yel TaxID=1847730 RepID=UPI00106BCBD2|nr:rhodanese-like domain-containing protein [Methylacidiphilum sp. Yel]TFE66746.1 sulfurtransferase [Methylacidiphilum sp. Yel]